MKLLHTLTALALYVTGAWLAAKYAVEGAFPDEDQRAFDVAADEIWTEYEAEDFR